MKTVLRCFILALVFAVLQSEARVRKHRVSTAGIKKSNVGQNLQAKLDPDLQQTVPSRTSAMRTARRKENIAERRNQDQLDQGEPEILDRKEKMRLAMLHMFGFDQTKTPTPETRNLTGNVTKAETSRNTTGQIFQDNFLINITASSIIPPDFMLDLHRVYNNDKNFMIAQSKIRGDTIRSFFPISLDNQNFRVGNTTRPLSIVPFYKGKNVSSALGETNHLQVFAFNLSSVMASESIVGAQLKAHGLRNMALQQNSIYSTSWKISLAVYETKKVHGHEVIKRYNRLGPIVTLRTVNRQSWTNRNMARIVSKARHRRRIIVARFEAAQNEVSAPRKINSRNLESLPRNFVLAASNEQNNHSSLFPLTPIMTVYCNDTKITDTIENFPHGMLKKPRIANKFTKVRKSQRDRQVRSSMPSSDNLKNELPGEIDVRSSSTFSPISRNDQTELHDNGISERKLIQTLEDRRTMSKKRKQRKRRSRKCRKGKRKDGRKRRCNKKLSNEPTSRQELNRISRTCSRRALVVDFEEIGWSDWIISPKKFNAYYCAGTCEFLTIKGASPSNHAIIQSFVNEFEINPEVPKPCCVPESLMSLSVLYFNQDDSVVLKVYPNMSVEKCACR